MMKGWLPTTALIRAVCLAALGLGMAVVLGDPTTLVLAAPFPLLAALALLRRPGPPPTMYTSLDHRTLHEGQGTRARLRFREEPVGVEHVTRIAVPAPYVALHPADGNLGYLQGRGPEPVIEVSPRRWGARSIGTELVGLTSAWSGFRLGPTELTGLMEQGGPEMFVLPQPAAFDARAQMPQPLGLVGQHRSRRTGDGSEFASIRPFRAGDRLRRVNWRVSLRSEELHVVSALAEEDAEVLLLVDALADHGSSGGVDGAASSLDVTIRSAAAVAEHYIRSGDRVALRVVGPGQEHAAPRAGRRQLRRIQGLLARVRPGEPRELTRIQVRATAGTIVLVLTPMLSPLVASTATSLVARGLSVLVIDTLPEQVVPARVEGQDPETAELAWRIRRLERDAVLGTLAGAGCPVVHWLGPGTLDEVLLRLARRSQLARVRVR
jgi:uncharacterized protein (DUF58 family)